MKELLISKYIDNELTLDDKIEFIKEIKDNDNFFNESIDMLNTEKLLNFDISYDKPLKKTDNKILPFRFAKKNGIIYQTLVTAAIFLVMLSVGLGVFKNHLLVNKKPNTVQKVLYRFVYYNPNAKSVAVMGSFTGWKKVYMQKVDGTGYWQLYAKLPKKGIYKYNFVVGNKKIIHDPSNPARIYNGFGGFDSVLRI